MSTESGQASGAEILKKFIHAQKSESFHPHSAGTHCALYLLQESRCISCKQAGLVLVTLDA